MKKFNVYDSCIQEWMQLSESHLKKTRATGTSFFSFPKTTAGSASAAAEQPPQTAPWPDGGSNQLLFESDTAFEFGGKQLPAVGGQFLTDSEKFVTEDGIQLLGPDIFECRSNTPYARIALIRVNAERMGEEKELFQRIRRIDYTRYHVNPEGFMVRISSMNHREAVRVSKEAVHAGISFQNVGHNYIEAYHRHAAVEAVQMIFITDPAFPYADLQKLTAKAEDITRTMDHLLSKVQMDCDTCGLRQICDEVEELMQ